MEFDVKKVRADFPILKQLIYNKPLVYFDNAATTQKPLSVIESISEYYKTINSNIHRGVHHLSILATNQYEETREITQKFINAKNKSEIIFTRGTTESINLIANTFAKRFINKNDEVVISTMEHHSNIVPWQMVCEEREAKLKVIPINESGEIIFEEFEKLLNEKTKIVAITHISNVLGTINPIKKIIEKAHSYNIPVLIDGAQSSAHMKVDVQELDCDFFCFSGHKMYGPTGIGVLYGKEKILDELPPYQGGGDMIDKVTFEKTTYNRIPLKFEAGTQNIADAIGLKAAIEYINKTGINNIFEYEDEILKYATGKMMEIEGMKIYGTAKNKTSVISFLIGNIKPDDAGEIIDKFGIAVRTGHHCAQPLMDWYKIPGTVRASFAFYNTKEEIDMLVRAIERVKVMFL
ncbi:MAG: cysteine desulfurase [Bacteroidales bacterium]|nr:cysteine desulfurase [Bacteroidales bacterium]